MSYDTILWSFAVSTLLHLCVFGYIYCISICWIIQFAIEKNANSQFARICCWFRCCLNWQLPKWATNTFWRHQQNVTPLSLPLALSLLSPLLLCLCIFKQAIHIRLCMCYSQCMHAHTHTHTQLYLNLPSLVVCPLTPHTVLHFYYVAISVSADSLFLKKYSNF